MMDEVRQGVVEDVPVTNDHEVVETDALFTPEVKEYLAPQDPARRDDDLVKLLRNDYITRSIVVAPKCVVTMRDLKTRQYATARRMARITMPDNTITEDTMSAIQYEFALSFVSYAVNSVEQLGTSLDTNESGDDAQNAFRERMDIISKWPAVIWTRIVRAFSILMSYVDELSSPTSMLDF